MNLYELQKQYKTQQSSRKYYKNKLDRLENELLNLKSPQFDKERIDGNPITRSMNDIVADKIQVEHQLMLIMADLADLEIFIKEMESILKEYNDTDQLIYLERHLKDYRIDKIAQRYNYSRRQIYNILKKVEESLGLHKSAR